MESSGASQANSLRSDNAARDFLRHDVTFRSEAADLSGWLYLPDSAPPWPLLIMAHGYSATRRMTADRYAEVICSTGLAVLLYDHRGFGASAGEPRRVLNTWSQARGYRDAILFACTLQGISSDRIALWGDSLSGGVALAVAGIDTRVAALVVQVPAIGSQLPPADDDGSLYETVKETIISGDIQPSEDEVLGPMPVVSDDPIRRPSALQPLTAYKWFIEYGGRLGSEWINDVSRARPKTPAPWHPGLCAPHVQCPTLFIVSPEDEMPGSVPAVSRDAFEKVSARKEWIEVRGGHFGLLYHPSEEFDLASSAQAAFLRKYL
ncbi:MAG: alpha/beta fold hydrolase [Dehalococcoidia bacterium]|nr:alpha/beta fold hydrolase [Dehalococcoidia bacterium]